LHLLAASEPERVRARTRAVLEHCAAGGGYACGSGNSIPNYVPLDNYLTMLETINSSNGR
jgi:uroporphyrinogen decarboxylase